MSDRAAVVSTARTRNPDHIVVAGDGVTQAQLVLLHELRRTSPNSALVVCTERSDRDTVMALGKVPVGGILVWADVTAEALHRSLVLVSGGLHVMSRHAMEALVRPAGQRSSEATLSDLERRIIHGLDQELSEQEIAEAEAMSLSTVRRTVRSVKAKLGVRSLYRVGRMVERLGLSD